MTISSLLPFHTGPRTPKDEGNEESYGGKGGKKGGKKGVKKGGEKTWNKKRQQEENWWEEEAGHPWNTGQADQYQNQPPRQGNEVLHPPPPTGKAKSAAASSASSSSNAGPNLVLSKATSKAAQKKLLEDFLAANF